MQALKIIEINNTIFKLKDKANKKTVKLMIEFYNVTPKVGDTLVLPKVLLDIKNEQFAQPYAFEPIKDNELVDETDVVGLIQDENKILLKRIYG